MYAHTQLLSIRWDAEKKYLIVVILHDCCFSYVCGKQLYNAQGELQIQHSIGHTLKTFKHLFSFREIERLIFSHLIHRVEPIFSFKLPCFMVKKKAKRMALHSATSHPDSLLLDFSVKP